MAEILDDQAQPTGKRIITLLSAASANQPANGKSMLNFVTDQRAGEPDLLTPVMHAAFEIRSLSGNVLKTIPAPASGWTHAHLVAVAVEHDATPRDGADGYLGGEWVGSTEL